MADSLSLSAGPSPASLRQGRGGRAGERAADRAGHALRRAYGVVFGGGDGL
ncbi:MULTISPECIES: hypothetical protein [unclassified Streptomyces]|uniref:hypothetical protein n=1 Tax=unclassified Streptomyces TaxID=2593676 RepID=UPI000B27517E|nr:MULTISPECIES: hypothetical protein [unclassified Streptomyces]